jgi:hypothetical protein
MSEDPRDGFRPPHPGMLLDDIIPEYDAASRHSTFVSAEPPEVYRVARAADFGRGWLVRLLMGVRAAPALTLAVLGGRRSLRVPAAGAAAVGAVRFTLIDEKPGEEFVLGIMGRFWQPTGGLVPADAGRLRQLPGPGLAQGIWNFRVEPSGEGSLLSTETRVRCGDEAARVSFLRYWRFIRPASGLIRRSMLRQIKLSVRGIHRV